MSTVPVLFRRLVDDAALFPPGNAPMERAVIEHAEHKHALYANFVGRFLCKDSRVPEWEAQHASSDEPVQLGIIADNGAQAAARTIAALRDDAGDDRPATPTTLASGVVVDAVEVPLAVDADLPGAVHAIAQKLAGEQLYVEIPLAAGWPDAVAACAERGVGAKLRTGGLSADAFPTPHEVADFISACVAAGTPFKCTAGLHHAVCHTDPATGFHHHGFLNILVATHAAITGADVFAAVTARDPADLAAVCWGIDDASARAVREAFVGFGSCSIVEPLEDLAALGLIEAALLGARLSNSMKAPATAPAHPGGSFHDVGPTPVANPPAPSASPPAGWPASPERRA
jgi:hypothetical protein